jgi:transposase
MKTGQEIRQNTTSDTIILPREEYNQLVSSLNNLQADYLILRHHFEQLQKMIFGAKSERFVPVAIPGQLTLELDAPEIEAPKQEEETITYTRKKNAEVPATGHARLPIPANIPRVEVILEPEQDLTGAIKIGEEITEILDYKPSRLFVKKFVRPKYKMPEVENVIVIAELPSLPIPRGNAGAGLLSHILVSKYVDHLPLYRQIQQFKRQQITLADSTINDWVRASCNLLEPLYNRLKQRVIQSDYLMADETPIPVLTEDKKGSTHRGYLWVYFDPLRKLVCFDYRKTRERAGPLDFLKDFKGSLQTDGYSAYNEFDNFEHVTLLACLVHARRKFSDCLKIDKKRAEHALSLFKHIYDIERQAREQDLCFEDRKALRIEKAVPVLDELKQWMTAEIVKLPPKNAIAMAMAYSLRLWHRLIRYVDDGKYLPDNNLIENTIRVPVLGRKNYMFAGSHEGAQRAAMLYSLLGTCKQLDVEPYRWLEDVLTRISDCKMSQLDELLPQNWVDSAKED